MSPSDFFSSYGSLIDACIILAVLVFLAASRFMEKPKPERLSLPTVSEFTTIFRQSDIYKAIVGEFQEIEGKIKNQNAPSAFMDFQMKDIPNLSTDQKLVMRKTLSESLTYIKGQLDPVLDKLGELKQYNSDLNASIAKDLKIQGTAPLRETPQQKPEPSKQAVASVDEIHSQKEALTVKK